MLSENILLYQWNPSIPHAESRKVPFHHLDLIRSILRCKGSNSNSWSLSWLQTDGKPSNQKSDNNSSGTVLPLQGPWVPPLVRELRYHLPSGSQKKKKSNDSSIFCLAPHLLTWNENTTPFLATVVRIRCYSDRTEGKAHFQGKMLTRMYR